MSDVKNFLSKLREKSDESIISCYVPSLHKTVDSKQLSVKQQKEIIQTSLDGVASGISFSIVLNNIIKHNIPNSGSLLVLDRPSIFLKIRNKSQGSIAYAEDNSKIDFAKNLHLTVDPSTVLLKDSITYEGIQVLCSVPNIDRDQEGNLTVLPIVKQNTDKNIGASVGDIFVYEIAKFITSISFDSIDINCLSLPIKDVVAIVETLPSALNNKIIQFINDSARVIENKYLVVDENKIAFDSRFFAIE